MDTLIKDLKYALRSLRRQPGFTIITIVTLALGIGANTAVFSVVNGVVLRPLPYKDPSRLMFVTSQFPNLGFDQFWVSLPEFIEYRDRNHVFESVGAYQVGAVNLGASSPSRPVRAVITAELMPTLGVPPMSGRFFTSDDTLPSAEPVAILSWELWQRSFAADPNVLNQKIQVNNVATRVVGIMPRGYDVHDQKIEMWEPLTIDPSTFANRRGSHFLYLIGRLKPGVSIAQARADLDVLLAQWATLNPGAHAPAAPGHKLRIDPLKEDVVGPVRKALLVLQGAVIFVLFIACANLANLIIARADSRVREYAVRAALGASRRRLLRQLLTEGLVLAVGGAAIGVGLAYGGLQLLLSINPDAIPRTAEVGLNLTVLGFTLVLACVTGLVFGLVPLAHLRNDRVGPALKDAGGRGVVGRGRARVRSALVVAEIALAVMLVVGAGLLIRSFVNLMRVDLGFNRSQLSTFGVVLPPTQYNTPEKRLAFYQKLTDSLRTKPGVQAVSAMTGLPPLRNVNANDTDFEHIPPVPPGAQRTTPIENVDFWQTVTLGYTETMGIPAVKGRTFDSTDVGGAPVALVNEALVAKFFDKKDPIGAHVKPGFGNQIPWFTIVGVLKDVKQGGVDAKAGTELYLLDDQLPRTAGFSPGQMNVVVRSPLPLEKLAPEFRRAVGDLDATLPLVRMRSMDDVVDGSMARPRFLTMLLGVFAGLALALAAVGTYGILSYLVAERRQEIGIRMALGADRGTILRLVLRRGLLLAVVGLVVGIGGALSLTRVLRSLLFDVTPTDPITLAAVAGVIALVAAIACAIPAWRAARVDPLIVLREA
jgi:predicted permease